MPSVLPANPKDFQALIAFSKEILSICDHLSIKPVVYGSLAYFGHTGDSSLPVRDLDLLVPEAKFPELLEALSKLENIRYELMPYHSIEVYRGELEVDLDSIEHFLDPRSRKTVVKEIGGLTVNLLNRESLISIYQEALDNMPHIEKLDEKRAKYTMKLNNLKASP